tara:strand:+ start:11636 stop:12136 length:501 start_codon:yes stop_codon:yes gene_type:complete
MGLIVKPHNFVAGQAAIATEVNSDFDTIYSEFNGQIDTANISTNQTRIQWGYFILGVPGAGVTKDILFKTPADIVVTPVELYIAYTDGAAGLTAEVDLIDITGGGAIAINTATPSTSAVNTPASTTSFVAGSIAASRTLILRITLQALFAGEDLSVHFIGKQLLTT